MKKTQWKYLLKCIRKSFASFVAVAFIAGTSIAFYCGLMFAADAELKSADRYFNEQHLADFEVTCANGITQEDVDALVSCGIAAEAEGGYKATAVMKQKTEGILVQVLSRTEKVNQPVIVSGRLPEGKNEIAIEEMMAEKKGIATGDTVRLSHDGMFYETEFTVTGIINDPRFNCSNGRNARGMTQQGLGAVEFFVETSADAFDPEYYHESYPAAYLRDSSLEGIYYYSDEYTSASGTCRKELEAFGEERAQKRYEELKSEADEKLADMREKLSGAGLKIPDAEQKIADVEETYADAGEDAAEIEKKDWVVCTRDEMGDIYGIGTVVEGMRGLSYSLSFIFLVVAVMICYASASRLINEQRTLIGTQKAMGFSAGEVLRHYMWYNILCAILGIVSGLIAAVVIVEELVLHVAYGRTFLFKDIRVTFVWKAALISAVLCFAVFLAATYIACWKLAKTPATTLLRGEVPVKGKGYFFEKWKYYQRMSLYNKVMIKNVIQDKSRAVVTVMGVVGGIALLVTSFSMKFAIENAAVRQYDDYYHYNQQLIVNSEKGDIASFRKLLEDEGVPFAQIQEKMRVFRANGGSYNTAHIVAAADADALAEWVRIEDISTKEEISIPSEGVLISRRCAEENDLEAGDTIEIADSKGNPVSFEVAGVFEHYLPSNLFYMSPEYFEGRLGESTDECVFLLKDAPESIAEQASQLDGFLALKDNSEDFEASGNLALVIICLILSAVMTFLVLLNQGITYINRKSRELAVMRINGFSLLQTKAYIYKDNIVLTLLGLLLGSCAGVGLSYINIRFLEIEASRYDRAPNGLACLLSCLACSGFALIVNLIALRRVNHLNLTNVNEN